MLYDVGDVDRDRPADRLRLFYLLLDSISTSLVIFWQKYELSFPLLQSAAM